MKVGRASFACVAALSLFAHPALSQSAIEVDTGKAARQIKSYTKLTDDYGKCLFHRIQIGTGIDLADVVIDAAIEKCKSIHNQLQASNSATKVVEKIQARMTTEQRQEAERYMTVVMADPVIERHMAIRSVVEYQFKLKAGGFTAASTARSK